MLSDLVSQVKYYDAGNLILSPTLGWVWLQFNVAPKGCYLLSYMYVCMCVESSVQTVLHIATYSYKVQLCYEYTRKLYLLGLLLSSFTNIHHSR